MGRYKLQTMSNEFDEFNSWKTLLYKEECESILSGEFKPPITMHVYPTNLCNYDCDWCIMKEERKNGGSLSKDVFENLINSMNSMGIKCCHISGGGETTTYKYIDLIKGFNGTKVLSTNGSFLTTKYVYLFDRIRISLDAGTKETHKLLKKSNNFDDVIKRIRECVSYKKEKYPNKTIGLGFVLNYDNCSDVIKFCDLANQLDVDFVHIRPAYYSKNSDNDKMVKSITKLAFETIEGIKKNSKVKIFSLSEKFDGFWTEKKYEKCLATPLHCVVTATGNLSVCQDMFIKFGDLNKQNLEDIWGSKEHKEAISKIEISGCPRCVMNKPNEIIENVFKNNRILKELI